MKQLALTCAILATVASLWGQDSRQILIEKSNPGDPLVNARRITTHYGPHGLPIQEDVEHWKNGKFEIHSIRDYLYSDNNLLIGEILRNWNSDQSQFDTSFVYNYEYNGLDRLVYETNRKYCKNECSLTTVDSSVYTVDGHLAKKYHFLLDIHTGLRTMQWAHFFEYRADGLMVKDSLMNYLGNGSWRGSLRNLYYYLSSGQLDSLIMDGGYNPIVGWIRSKKEFYVYNSLGQLTYREEFGPTMNLNKKTHFHYNSEDSLHQYQTYKWSTINHSWEIVEQGTYTYQTTQLSVNEISTGTKVQIFPNPVKNEFTVRLDGKELKDCQLILYSAQGNEIMTRSFLESETLDIDRSHLKSGLYHYEIRKGTQRISSGTLVFE
ncbi:T9SS type A sorting domain-containing protein [bacterium SCSIO 12741]|nr:T9SS type A sorting domain-containing protein [bacterium SCSIO 12741]